MLSASSGRIALSAPSFGAGWWLSRPHRIGPPPSVGGTLGQPALLTDERKPGVGLGEGRPREPPAWIFREELLQILRHRIQQPDRFRPLAGLGENFSKCPLVRGQPDAESGDLGESPHQSGLTARSQPHLLLGRDSPIRAEERTEFHADL